ncbi:cytochrome b, partial [Undibacterium sp.]|uniref:cytochrome b n=1 Tax=Undibacterium sp. TaxID=1914977 RepID=UPI002B59C1F5
MLPKFDKQQVPVHYDRRTIMLHWLTAALVILVWLCGHFIDAFPKGLPRWNMRGVHMLIGIILGAVVFYRLWWRISSADRLPALGNTWVQLSSRAMHIGLYALLIAEVLLGLFNAWVRGEHVFNLFVLPAFDPGNKSLR